MQPITRASLLVTTNDRYQNRTIRFIIASPPILGQIVRQANSTMNEVSGFTQDDIDADLIYYRMRFPMDSGEHQEDEFVFTVEAFHAQSIPFTNFKVRISFSNINQNNIARLVHVYRGSVDEGGDMVLSPDHINLAPLQNLLRQTYPAHSRTNYIVAKLPQHGILLNKGYNMSIGQSFHQDDVNTGQLVYRHDHSDTANDSIGFAIAIDSHRLTARSITNKQPKVTFLLPIIILPIDDQTFKLVTITPEIEVVQGYSTKITRKELLTEDEDTPPSGILYEIISSPASGRIVLDGWPGIPTRMMFTQKDINEGKITFVQDGSLESGDFYLRVSDTLHRPSFKVVTVKIIPLFLELNSSQNLIIIQSHSYATITEKNLPIRTNGDIHSVAYNVTKKPKFGLLFMNGSEVTQFWHDNVTSGFLLYIQTNLSSGWDKFEYTVYNQLNVIQGREMLIQPKALIMERETPPEAIAGKELILSLAELDASELADATSSTPIYYVVRPPQHGTLYLLPNRTSASNNRKIKRSQYADPVPSFLSDKRQMLRPETARQMIISRNKRKPPGLDDDKTLSFTHRDIINGLVVYKADETHDDWTREDTLTLLLTAQYVQSCTYTLHIAVKPDPKAIRTSTPQHNHMPSTTTAATKAPVNTTPAKAASEVRSSSAGYGRDHLTVVGVLIGITAVIIALFIAFKCFQRRRKLRKLQKLKEDSRTPLSNGDDPYKSLMVTAATTAPSTIDGSSKSSSRAEGELLADSALPVQVIEYTAPPKAGSSLTVNTSPTPKVTRTVSNAAISLDGKPPYDCASDDANEKFCSMPMLQARRPIGVSEVKYAGGTCRVTSLENDNNHITNYSRPSPSPSPPPPPIPPPPLESPSTPVVEKVTAANWDTVDPELLQHFRTSHPVLHKSKYWV